MTVMSMRQQGSFKGMPARNRIEKGGSSPAKLLATQSTREALGTSSRVSVLRERESQATATTDTNVEMSAKQNKKVRIGPVEPQVYDDWRLTSVTGDRFLSWPSAVMGSGCPPLVAGRLSIR
jgi:hypothetical protein